MGTGDRLDAGSRRCPPTRRAGSLCLDQHHVVRRGAAGERDAVGDECDRFTVGGPRSILLRAAVGQATEHTGKHHRRHSSEDTSLQTTAGMTTPRFSRHHGYQREDFARRTLGARAGRLSSCRRTLRRPDRPVEGVTSFFNSPSDTRKRFSTCAPSGVMR